MLSYRGLIHFKEVNMKNESKKMLNLASGLLIISSVIFLVLTIIDKSNNIYLPLCLGSLVLSNIFSVVKTNNENK